ncbi:MAG: heparinase, partial [Pseudomonadaceae bacterium]|nr:heparinase [Pseudomonadaceae bacterium]
PEVGDIKQIWELSRFDWALALAQSIRVGNTASLTKLNTWLADWCTNNPPYKGPNWKCGQEASIRVMHLAMAAKIMGQVKTANPALLDLIKLHLQRIEPTIQYAVAQDNNHGTSEAAALFIGGSWLEANGIAEGGKWKKTGYKWLENRSARLIGKDGSFSQYSLNYHRVMLDTFCMVEIWRKELSLPLFSKHWYVKAKAASEWLRALINPINGDGPNLGANDGARLLPLSDTNYRDYRTSVQLAMVLFTQSLAYSTDGDWNIPLKWLEINVPSTIAAKPQSTVFDDGGFAILRNEQVMALLRYPRFKFRPSHADALHVDLWVENQNVLRDAGTYTYNTDKKWLGYFPGTESHNTVQFDDRDQMPRLSRFLFGNWLKTSFLEPLQTKQDQVTFAAGYTDSMKAKHHRAIALKKTSLQVTDKVEGFSQKAVLRWRLAPGNWLLQGNRVTNGKHELEVFSSAPIARFELVTGWESRFYLEKTEAPVLEVEIHQPGTLTSEYRWIR